MPGPAPIRILVADDEPSILELMRNVLDLWGYQVELCPNGGEALKSVSQSSVDLLLIDNLMPVLSGVEVLRRLRSTHPALPAILMSGYISQEDRQACAELGKIDVLSKPFSLDELRSSLTRLLGSRESQG
jgi:CheY-like chemotaxis protein